MLTTENFYYHWNPRKLKRSDIIIGGGFGVLLNISAKFDQPARYFLELEFERIRRLYYHFKQSRFNAIFLLISKESCIKNLYQVKISFPNEPIHKAAIYYWGSKTDNLILEDGTLEKFPQEVLTESYVKVINQIFLFEIYSENKICLLKPCII